MSNSDILIDVVSPDASSEVMVIDSDFQLMARGIGSIQVNVAPGIYRAIGRVGDQENEQLFAVDSAEPENRKVVELPMLEFSSPIPLNRTLTSREFHQSAIRQKIASNPSLLEDEAGIVIFLRDPSCIYFDLAKEMETLEGEAKAKSLSLIKQYAQNFAGFALSNLDGTSMSRLEDIGSFTPDLGYLIVSATVKPGAYALTRPALTNEDPVCLPLVVPAGWTLQVFVSMLPDGNSTIGRLADFDGAAMLFEPPGRDFNADRPDLRTMEVLRNAIVSGHYFINEDDIQLGALEPIDNPMFFLLAAQLILHCKTPDTKRLIDMVNKVANSLGPNFPDVLILSWKLKQADGLTTSEDAEKLVSSLNQPPILQLSWHYLMEAYRSCDHRGRFDERISRLSGNLIASSVWLSWIGNNGDNLSQSAIELNQLTPVANKLQTGVVQIAKHGIKLLQNYLLSKLGKNIEVNVPNLETSEINTETTPSSSTTKAASAFEALLFEAGVIASEKLNTLDLKVVVNLFSALAQQFDWGSLVARLRDISEAGDSSYRLTPLQQQLLMSLKAAREYFDDKGKLPLDVVFRRLNSTDVPLEAIIHDLNKLFSIAFDFGNKVILALEKNKDTQ
ncbi:MAG: hypothetical protein CVU33_04450 [Betaproteobacteria bacterium HGW-Betaproteobacteria-6]|jgi:hypothetical protein|nr:MAG: hypothetical protein CVU33_04450 [Betaproteobacteria bacterium HGW-Betaproteobacteria-6]